MIKDGLTQFALQIEKPHRDGLTRRNRGDFARPHEPLGGRAHHVTAPNENRIIALKALLKRPGVHGERPGNELRDVGTRERRGDIKKAPVLERERLLADSVVEVSDGGGHQNDNGERNRGERAREKRAGSGLAEHDYFAAGEVLRIRQPRPRRFSIISLPIFLRTP